MRRSRSLDCCHIRDRRRQMRNNDLRTELEYFSKDYDKEREMEPRPEPARAVTLPLRAASPSVRKRKERVVGFEETQNRGESMVERNSEGGKPSEEASRGNGSQNVNLPPLLVAHIGRSENGQRLQSSLTFAYGGQALPNNVGGNLPPNAYVCAPKDACVSKPNRPFPEPFRLSNTLRPLDRGLCSPRWTEMPSHIGSYDGKGDPDNFLHLFEGAIRMQKCQKAGSILDYEDLKAKFRSHFSQQKKFIKTHLAVHNIKQRENENLPLTYKGLMEKTYTWVEAREVATNGVSSNRRDSFERPKKSSWDNNRGQKNKDRHDTNDFRHLKVQIQEAINSGQLSYLVKGIKKEKAKSTDTPRGEGKKDKSTAPVEAPILMISRENYAAKDTISESMAYKEGIKFPPVTRVSNAPVIIEAAVFGRKVGRVYMDSGSTCEVIYEHCFEKLNPTIKATRVNTKTPLVGFSGKRSWSVGEVPLEITIREHPFSRTETLNFVIVKSDSPHNMLLGRTTMHKMGIVVSTIYGAIKFHTKKGVGTVLSVGEAREETKKARRTLTISKERIPSYDDT
ncbi:reverse transcriptase domain-containing protein [Tanacetum coccineum]|uniref:Reverse transcriptase domain-containing protein n=1 Tax=Tanacetum coccineum TaxID=301880 RepID=A0ABQ5IJB8_9ASTR